MERLWEGKDWEGLAELETKVWVDGWGQPPDRIDPGLREKVHGWILASMEAEKPEGKQQRLDPPAAERLGDLEAPTLVLIGQADEPAAVLAERHLASSVAGAKVVEFQGVAHMIHLEEPQRFNELVLEFLAGA
jgi:pimeloyl-ACP methyl ester carboxylesterase